MSKSKLEKIGASYIRQSVYKVNKATINTTNIQILDKVNVYQV